MDISRLYFFSNTGDHYSSYYASMDTLLNELLKNGILDETVICKIKEMENQEYLKKHRYKIYQNKDGRWVTYLPDRKRIQRKDRAELEKLIVSYYKDNASDPTINDIYALWNKRRVEIGKIKPSTATRFDHDFEKFFADFGKERISMVTPNDISTFLEDQVAKYHLSRKAFSNLKTLTKGIFKKAKRMGLFTYSVEMIFQDLDMSEADFKPKIVDDAKEIFYDDEIEMVTKYCKDHLDDLSCLGVLLLFATGLRVGEVVCLKGSDILNGEIYVHRTETQFRLNGKNYFEVSEYPKTPAGIRRVIVPDSYLWLLDILKKAPDFIFIGMHGNRMHTNQIRKRLYQICKKLDIPLRSPHKLRKTYGTILLDNHVDSKMIEKQMGHTDITTTELHYHRDRKRAQQKREIINSIAELK